MSLFFDFIVVGGGTAGCRIAYKLANAPTKPSVLLIETGGNPVGDTISSPYDRYTPAFTRPDLDHGYSTVAQKALNDRVIPYLRGKGLGGSSILNFMSSRTVLIPSANMLTVEFAVYLYGSKEDYDRWARLVGDESWNWEHTKEIFKTIENYHSSASSAYSEYANPLPEEHGKEGSVDISLPTHLEKGVDLFLDACFDYGHPRNLDPNSGNPIGMGIFPATYYQGMRTTSATAHLSRAPSNLVVMTDLAVTKIHFHLKRATGVSLENQQMAIARKEVILAAGAFDSPKLLLLSGVGPVSQIESHNIPLVHELRGVGKNLQDHPIVFLNVEVDSQLSEKYAFEIDTVAMKEARELWAKDKTGPLSHHNGTVWGGFLKLPDLENSEEYKELDPDTRAFLEKPTVPAFEMALSAPMLPPGHELPASHAYLSDVIFLMNPQSRGQIALASDNPKDAPLIDVGFLSHPFDKRALLLAIRESMKFFENSRLAKYFNGYVLGPKSSSDEDIEEFIKDQAGPVWHANGTVMMGKPDDLGSCVDTNFCVHGLQNLRVADLSVCPLTVNNHPQSLAYLIGERAARSIIEEWKL